MAATQICCVPAFCTTPYSRLELNATQYRSPGGAQVGCEFSVCGAVAGMVLFEIQSLAFTRSTAVPPVEASTWSRAVRSPWPPTPRENAIHLPSGENWGNRLE